MCTSTSTQLPRTITPDPWSTDEFKAAVAGSAECLEWLRNEALLDPGDLRKSVEIEAGETHLAETVGAEGQGEAADGQDGAAAEGGGDTGDAEKKEGEGEVEAKQEADEGKEGEEGAKNDGPKKLSAAEEKKERTRMNKLTRPTKDTPCILRPLIKACRDGLADVCGVLCQGLSDEKIHKGVVDEGGSVHTSDAPLLSKLEERLPCFALRTPSFEECRHDSPPHTHTPTIPHNPPQQHHHQQQQNRTNFALQAGTLCSTSRAQRATCISAIGCSTLPPPIPTSCRMHAT